MMFEVLNCAEDVECTQKNFTEGMIYVVTLIGGLVSALVVSKLAIAPPPQKKAGVVASVQLDVTPEPAKSTFAKVVSIASIASAIAYLTVWLITGLSALIVGVVFYPGISSTISDIGTTWLGLAVASAYAYFGLDASKQAKT